MHTLTVFKQKVKQVSDFGRQETFKKTSTSVTFKIIEVRTVFIQNKARFHSKTLLTLYKQAKCAVGLRTFYHTVLDTKNYVYFVQFFNSFPTF